jgi:hypothetical protein
LDKEQIRICVTLNGKVCCNGVLVEGYVAGCCGVYSVTSRTKGCCTELPSTNGLTIVIAVLEHEFIILSASEVSVLENTKKQTGSGGIQIEIATARAEPVTLGGRIRIADVEVTVNGELFSWVKRTNSHFPSHRRSKQGTSANSERIGASDGGSSIKAYGAGAGAKCSSATL